MVVVIHKSFLKSAYINSSIKFIQTNGSVEYINNSFKTFCHKIGLVHHVSCPHTSEQNGLVRHKHHNISTIIRLLLNIAHALFSLWNEAAVSANFIINLPPSSIIGWSSPYFSSFWLSPKFVLS